MHRDPHTKRKFQNRLNRLASAIAVASLSLLPAPARAQTRPAEQPAKSDYSALADTWLNIDSPDTTEAGLDYIYEPHTGMFKFPLLDNATSFLVDKQRELFEETGLRVGFRYMSQYQFASGGPGERQAGADDIDLMFDWTLVGKGTADTGRFVFSVEERYRTLDIPPSQLRNEIGSLVGTTGAFNDRGLAVRDAFWDQRLFDAKLRFLIGRAAPDDYVGSHRFQSSVMGFFNGNFSGNVTMPFPGHGPLALVSARPNDNFYVTVGGANAYSTTTQITVESLFDEGKIFTFGEAGWTPMFEGVGRGRYAITGWYMPAREDPDRVSDQGFSITCEQDLGERFWLYARYGYADQGVLTGVKSVYQIGAAVNGLLGSPDNVTGLGVAYAQPANDSLRDETSIDFFQRFQVTEYTQFTFGAQLFIDPSNAPDDDVVAVFSCRLRIEL